MSDLDDIAVLARAARDVAHAIESINRNLQVEVPSVSVYTSTLTPLKASLSGIALRLENKLAGGLEKPK